jgi:predicted RNase H-like HicB family nuclease
MKEKRGGAENRNLAQSLVLAYRILNQRGYEPFCKDNVKFRKTIKILDMFPEYIQAALERAQYKVIDNGDEPYFADVPELDGVWATGRTVEEARRNFIEALEEWIAARLQWGLPILPIGGQTIEVSKEPISVV